MIIDAHQHVFWHGRSDADLIADMDDHGIDVAWLLTWEIPPDESFESWKCFNPAVIRPDGLNPGLVLWDVLKARDHYPDRFVVGYCPDPRLKDAPELLESAYHMHEARVCGEWKFRMLIDDPRCLNLFRKAGELGCPVVVHLDVPYLPDGKGGWTYYPNWYGGTVENLRRAAQRCPETVFIGHGPGFWREISGDADGEPKIYPEGPVRPGGRLVKLMEDCPNLHADLSAGSGRMALGRDREHAKDFLDRFQDRLLFARDFFGKELHELLQGLDLPEGLWKKLYCQNAAHLVELPKGQG